jgi:hypothetical protein
VARFGKWWLFPKSVDVEYWLPARTGHRSSGFNPTIFDFGPLMVAALRFNDLLGITRKMQPKIESPQPSRHRRLSDDGGYCIRPRQIDF